MKTRSEQTAHACPAARPTCAMVLAAGLGTRMLPLTRTIPKPLVSIQGRCLLDRALDALEKAQVRKAVVNVHHLAGQICGHIENERNKRALEIVISDERAQLLDSAGGVIKALPHLGKKPFFILNSDTFWQDSHASNLLRLADRFAPQAMDMLLLTVSQRQAAQYGHSRGDFAADRAGRLSRARTHDAKAVVYAGALLVNPAVFAGACGAAQSLNFYFDRAIAEKRLFDLPLEGAWHTIGTVDMIRTAETRLSGRDAGS